MRESAIWMYGPGELGERDQFFVAESIADAIHGIDDIDDQSVSADRSAGVVTVEFTAASNTARDRVAGLIDQIIADLKGGANA